MTTKITPFLMFEGKAEEAMNFYVSLFENSRVTSIKRYGPGEAGAEGGWFYSGRGDERGVYSVPVAVSGVRIRRWPNEGFDAEYADVLAHEVPEIAPESLDFDVRQRYSMLDENFV